MEKFEQILDFVDLFSKINLLEDWDLINKEMKEKMFCLKEVRNGFAHEWDIKKVRYRNKPISYNFELFKTDAFDVFSMLVKLYNGREIVIDDLIKELSV